MLFHFVPLKKQTILNPIWMNPQQSAYYFHDTASGIVGIPFKAKYTQNSIVIKNEIWTLKSLYEIVKSITEASM